MKAIIVGAGPAGLAAAIALRCQGITAEVYERSDGLSREGTGLTLWPNGFRALDAIGAGSAVRAISCPAAGMAMFGASGRSLYEVSDSVMDSIGGNGVAVHRAGLIDALAGLLDPDVVRFGRSCTGVRTEGDRVIAEFADGGTEDADLLIGADGIRSGVRAAIGLDRPLRYAGFTVWRAVIPFSLEPLPGQLWLGGSGQFGIWRLPGERVYWFASAPVPEGGNLPVPGEFAGWHGPIPALLKATTPDRILVTDIYDCRPLRVWGCGRVALIGDAAHPMLPNVGQGTAQAFEDAVVLADCLSNASVPDAVRMYQVRRRKRANSVSAQARWLARLGNWRSPLACRVREQLIRSAPQGAQLRQLRRLFAFEPKG